MAGWENFKDLFSPEKLYAWKLYCKWIVDLQKKIIKELNKVVDMFHNHIFGIMNAFLMNLNAMAERLNGKIQDLKTLGIG